MFSHTVAQMFSINNDVMDVAAVRWIFENGDLDYFTMNFYSPGTGELIGTLHTSRGELRKFKTADALIKLAMSLEIPQVDFRLWAGMLRPEDQDRVEAQALEDD